MITILAGGTGSVKFVRGLISQTRDVNVVCNVGDNYWLYGLYVCPDIDTIIYGLADILDYEKGWGIRKDTFGFLRQMEIFGEETWFRIGDRDAATHLIRTNMLKNGKNLGDITKWMCQKFAVEAKIMPVTDNTIETRITTNKGEMHLQEFWVKYKGKDKVEGIQYIGADKARPNPEAVNAIHDSEMIIIAPGNPLTSIGPMLQIKGIRKELSKNRRKVVAVSPLIGNKAFSGPAVEYMTAAGIEVSPYGVAQMYSDVCGNIVIDSKDRLITKRIQNLDMKVFDTSIKMTNKATEDALASFVLKNVR
ncbi:MAG TPA: 2-phospho-L-lactate transferase [Candidatus Nitrosotenuis sp.]|jgi:LPPG:FO 2-phospho-L-lactate transferase|nr:2-phospho-L-lactate transferase [Candidatus Nitrosotenuis sp.]HII04294.1 2-phospho-L-lactate transferase [Candidatus Nitrosotenuis sp.]